MTTLSRRDSIAIAAMPLAHNHYPHETDKQVAYCLRLANELETALDAQPKEQEQVSGDAGFSRVTLEKDLAEWRNVSKALEATLEAERKAHSATAGKLKGVDVCVNEALALLEAHAHADCGVPECRMPDCLTSRAIKILKISQPSPPR